jgi:hypothetical protein
MTPAIHHFGDSYTTVNDFMTQKPKDNFIEILAKKLDYKYQNLGYCGGSNEMIFNILLKRADEIKQNQIIVVNFSFLTRGTYYDEQNNKIDATNTLYHEIYNKKYFEKANGDDKLLLMIDYFLNYHKDYNFRLFNLIDNFFKLLIKEKNIKIYYIHIDDMDYIDNLLTSGTRIKFEGGFGNWLKTNDFHKEEEGHYSKNIQDILFRIISDKTNDLNSKENCYITIKETKNYL